jgi:hypothetical protein
MIPEHFCWMTGKSAKQQTFLLPPARSSLPYPLPLEPQFCWQYALLRLPDSQTPLQLEMAKVTQAGQ